MSLLCYLGIITVGVAMLLMCGGSSTSRPPPRHHGHVIFAQMLQWFPAAATGRLPRSCHGRLRRRRRRRERLLRPGAESSCPLSRRSHVVVWSGLARWFTKGNTIPIRNMGFSRLSSTTHRDDTDTMAVHLHGRRVILYSRRFEMTRFGRKHPHGGRQPDGVACGPQPVEIQECLYVNNGVLAGIGGLNLGVPAEKFSPTGLTAGIAGDDGDDRRDPRRRLLLRRARAASAARFSASCSSRSCPTRCRPCSCRSGLWTLVNGLAARHRADAGQLCLQETVPRAWAWPRWACRAWPSDFRGGSGRNIVCRSMNLKL